MLLAAAAFFLVLCYVPFAGGELWGHVNYGDWILERGELPFEDPFMPLARGMDLVDGAWLSQVVLAAAAGAGGASALALVFALTAVTTYLILGWVFWLRSGRTAAALLALVAVLAVGWSGLTAFGPRHLALLLFAVLTWLVVRDEAGEGSLMGWIGLPLVFVFWANVHPSFAAGWVFLTCCLVARALEVGWRERSALAPLRDAETRRWIWRLELAVIAVVVNPYGARLLVRALSPGAGDPLGSGSAAPLGLSGVGSWAFVLAWIALLALVALRGEKLSPRDFLLLAVFGLAVASGVAAPSWFAVVVGWVAAPHLGSLLGAEIRRSRPRHELLQAGPVWTVAGGVVLWIAFALSPAADVVFGRESPVAGRFAEGIPAAVIDHLATAPATGQAFNPRWWGDSLVRFGPPELEPFVTANVALLPQQVWRDYLRISNAQADWERALERYRVETVIVDRARQRGLGSGLRELAGWRLVHEDREALVFRKAPRAEPAGAPEEATP